MSNSSFFGLSVFRLPSAFVRHSVPSIQVVPVDPVIYIQHIPQNYVGFIIITDSLSGYGYDVLLPKCSGKNSYGVFSGKIGGPYSDIDCARTLARSINIQLDSSTPCIEYSDPATGTPYKVYVKYVRRIDLPRLNSALRTSTASADFAYFTRFPTNTISRYQSCQCINNDAGVSCFLDASASALITRLISNIERFVF